MEDFSREFLADRRRHLVAKLAKTREALHREGLLTAAINYKVRVLIPQIITAIERCDDGVYGFCTECAEAIQKERLLRHPHVERCVRCQTEEENKRK